MHKLRTTILWKNTTKKRLTVMRITCYSCLRSNETPQNKRKRSSVTTDHIFFTRQRNAHYDGRKEGQYEKQSSIYQ